MRRLEDIGEEVRRLIGEPAPGPADDDLLEVLAGRRRSRRRRLRIAAAALLLIGGGVAVLLRPAADPPAEPGDLKIAAEQEVSLRQDPLASLLFESARLRLEGFGDRSAAGARLRAVVEDYPGTWSAARARRLLEEMGKER